MTYLYFTLGGLAGIALGLGAILAANVHTTRAMEAHYGRKSSIRAMARYLVTGNRSGLS